MAETKWKISGEYMESCNCDYICPCIVTNPQGPVTYDHCYSLMAYRIDRGNYGGVGLDGLAFALIIRSGKVMADGNWVFACVVDEAADSAQREALTTIVSGKAGGTPANIHDNLVGDFRGVEVKPIAVLINGLSRTVTIPGVLDFAVEGVVTASAQTSSYSFARS